MIERYHVRSLRQAPLPASVHVRANVPSPFFVTRKWLPESERASTAKIAPPMPVVDTVIRFQSISDANMARSVAPSHSS
jgi:hypothetical protein